MAFGERIPIKTRSEIEKMRTANRHVAEILLELREMVKPGITTRELDRHAEKAIAERGVESSFKGYDPHGLPKYPAVLCVSVNDEIVHGIPGGREIAEGDLVSIDFGVSVDGCTSPPYSPVESEQRTRSSGASRSSLDRRFEITIS